MGDDKPTNVRITCDHQGCGATARLDTPGWQISTFGERCPEHHLELLPVPPRPSKVVVSAHAWTFDPHHQAHRCTQCGIVSYDATPAGPCTCAPSTWLPPGADDAPVDWTFISSGPQEPKAPEPMREPLPYSPPMGEVIDGPRILCREHAPKVEASTHDMFDPFDVLRRMGEEARAEPMTADDEAMLVRIKAAVRRKLGET